MSDSLDRKLNQLKKQYDDMPTQSSVETIMTYIKNEEKKKRRFYIPKKLQFIAMLMLMIGIGYILGMNQLAKDEELATNEMVEEMYVHESADTVSGSEEGMEIVIMEEDEVVEDESMQVEEGMNNHVAEQTFTVDDQEGNEVEKKVLPLEGDHFMTFYDANDHYVFTHTFDVTRHQVYSHLIGENEEPVIFEWSYFHNGASLDDLIESYETILAKEGFSNFEEYTFIEETPIAEKGEIIYEFIATNQHIQTYVAVLEINGEFYFLRTSQYESYSELTERLSYEFNFMINQLSFN